jgi:hypothetical protein
MQMEAQQVPAYKLDCSLWLLDCAYNCCFQTAVRAGACMMWILVSVLCGERPAQLTPV